MYEHHSTVHPVNTTAEPDETIVTEKELIRELEQPRQLATDTPLETAPLSTAKEEQFSFDPPPNPEVKPFFPPPEDTEAGQSVADEAPDGKIAQKKAERKLAALLKARDILQARVLAKVAMIADKKHFRMNDEDLQILAEAYLPYMEEHGGKIPIWIEIVIAEAIVMGDKIAEAVNLRKVNLKNAELRNSPVVTQTIQAAITGPRPERKNYTIDDDGYYVNPPNRTRYIKKSRRTEKATLDDIDKILEDNDIGVVQQAFGFTDEQMQQYIKK